MNKRDLLPDAFVIKRDASHPDWQEFIDYINSFMGFNAWSGDAEGHYYGMIGNIAVGLSDDFDAEVLTLDMWKGIISGEDSYQEKVEDYNGEEVLARLCVTLSTNAPTHPGEVAKRSECTMHNSEWYLDDDVRRDIFGDTFIEGDEDYVWSEYESEWVPVNSDDISYCIINSRGHEDYARNCDSVFIEGHDLLFVNHDVADDNGYIRRGNGTWVHRDDYVSIEDCNASYHSLERVNKFSSSAKFTIGFEIEKEDGEEGLIDYESLYEDTKWIKENDSSLDEETGYELVSPAFNLYTDKLEKDIDSDERIKRLINAEYSTSCGGHINLASSEYSPYQLFEGLSSFFPLLYSLYEGRISRRYSEAKKKHKYYDRDKYSAVYIKERVLELRIFSAVPNLKTLLWRRDLTRIMCDNINCSELDVLKMLLDQKSKLYTHLRKVYSQEKLIDRLEKFVAYCDSFNNKKLPKIIRAEIKSDNIETTDQLGA